MYPLNLPEYSHKIKQEDDKYFIWDSFRRKYVVLTPEEWVRQNFLQYLVQEKQYPASLIFVEMPLKIYNLKRRSDIVMHNRKGKPIVAVECKAPTVKITQSTFDQIAKYNIKLKVEYLIVTNGLSHYCCQYCKEDGGYIFVREIPDYTTYFST